VGLNSLFGMVYLIMKETHMSWNEIMWRRSWITVQWMLDDAPKVIRTKVNGEKTISGKGLAARFKSKKRNE